MESLDTLNIATHAMLTLEFLNDFEIAIKDTPQQGVRSFFVQWQEKIQWDQEKAYALLNTDILLTLLYALVLVPHETFIEEIPPIPVRSLSSDTWGALHILRWPPDKQQTLPALLRVLRNAIAHGRVEVDQGCRFIFQDQTPESIQPHSEVAIDDADLFKFVKALGGGYVLGKWAGLQYVF